MQIERSPSVSVVHEHPWLGSGSGNLVQRYIDEVGGRDSEVIAELNAALGTRYTTKFLYDWRSGERPMPTRVWLVMAQRCLRRCIEDEGGTLPADSQAVDRLLLRLINPAILRRTTDSGSPAVKRLRARALATPP